MKDEDGPRLFAEVDGDGRPNRFYDKGIWGNTIPDGALHISEEMHLAAITNPGEVKWNGERFVRCEAPVPQVNVAIVRLQRDRMLAASDWTQMGDAPLSKEMKTAWHAYRKQLRDLPSKEGWPNSFVWPSKPSFATNEEVN